MAAKEQSSQELRSKKIEVEQFAGALEQLRGQCEQLQKQVSLSFGCACKEFDC